MAVTEAALESAVRKLLPGRDLASLSLRDLRTEIEQHLGLVAGGLDAQKGQLKVVAQAEIHRLLAGEALASATVASPKKVKSKERQASAMTKKMFKKQANSFSVAIGDKELKAMVKEFSTGSCGFYGAGKFPIKVGDKVLMVQAQINCSVIGSKGWANE